MAKNWSESRLFEVNPDGWGKMFTTFPIPHMNGPVHLGHAPTCSIVDIFAGFKRIQPYHVLFTFIFPVTGEHTAEVGEPRRPSIHILV
ncbi:MAG: class I tRNA ligase family protein [Promethearchaeota archaeon]